MNSSGTYGRTPPTTHNNLKVESNGDDVSIQQIEILKMSLEFYYFWINFSPLTRGTAACGYSLLQSIMLSCNLRFKNPLPKDIQLDWEAIFSTDSNDFVNRMLPLLPISKNNYDSKNNDNLKNDGYGSGVGGGVCVDIDQTPKVEDVISTYRGMIEALL